MVLNDGNIFKVLGPLRVKVGMFRIGVTNDNGGKEMTLVIKTSDLTKNNPDCSINECSFEQ